MFYFHVQNGTAVLDLDGVELADMAAARGEAEALIAGMLRDGKAGDLTKHPLRVWITKEPSGPALFALNVTAQT